MGIVSAKKLWIGLLGAVFVCPSAALAQNDWQSPDPYFGAFQHRQAGTPEAERRYRAEIAPQQPQRAARTTPSGAWTTPKAVVQAQEPCWVSHAAMTS